MAAHGHAEELRPDVAEVQLLYATASLSDEEGDDEPYVNPRGGSTMLVSRHPHATAAFLFRYQRY